MLELRHFDTSSVKTVFQNISTALFKHCLIQALPYSSTALFRHVRLLQALPCSGTALCRHIHEMRYANTDLILQTHSSHFFNMFHSEICRVNADVTAAAAAAALLPRRRCCCVLLLCCGWCWLPAADGLSLLLLSFWCWLLHRPVFQAAAAADGELFYLLLCCWHCWLLWCQAAAGDGDLLLPRDLACKNCPIRHLSLPFCMAFVQPFLPLFIMFGLLAFAFSIHPFSGHIYCFLLCD